MSKSNRCLSPAIDWRGATDVVKQALLLPEALLALGARPHGRNRFDCPFCAGSGSRRDTLSVVKDRGWRCHRCGEYGDVITLVMKLRGCDFKTALKYLAEIGHVSVPDAMTPEERRRVTEQERLKRVRNAASRLEAEQHCLRLHYRTVIHSCEQRLVPRIAARLAELMNAKADEQAINSYWVWMAMLWEMLQEALMGYSILFFGNARNRAEFVLKPDKRQGMIADVRLVGGCFADAFPDDPPRFVEVLS